jgi:hypothetical protein
VTLPSKSEDLEMWNDIDPLEMGVGDLPPNFEDSNLKDRLLTWIRVRLAQPTSSTQATPQSTTTAGAQGKFSLLWAGLNTARITQCDRVTDELLPRGTGDPDQTVTLAKHPVVPSSVVLSVTANNKTETWTKVDDLLSAGAEVYVPDPRWPPGLRPSARNLAPSKVYVLDAESGEIRFGDGQRGTRPPLSAVLRASYDSCQ